jgi:hypothetical protein
VVRSEPASAAVPCTTTDPPPPAGGSCWTDVDPYPFGTEGEPVDATSTACRPPVAPGSLSYQGENLSCYLTVDSLAFRAWNRGLAATSTTQGTSPTPFGVWRFNGTRWTPDPTFPGRATCKGRKILWAGKLDYWLVGESALGDGWPALCRFDGANFGWQPLDVPEAALARVPIDPGNNQRKYGAITTGACFAWNDCWFFGDYGIVLHWDGDRLADASPDLIAQPWLRTGYTAATTGRDEASGTFAAAVGATIRPTVVPDENTTTPVTQPGGGQPPQMYVSAGAGFAPLDFWPPTIAQPNDPYRTDFVAAAFGSLGRGWLAANPAGHRTGVGIGDAVTAPAPTPEPAPLVPASPNGRAAGCPGPAADRFMYQRFPAVGDETYLWSSIATLPGVNDALAGGRIVRPTATPSLNDDGSPEPALVRARCDGAVTVTRFRILDPLSAASSPPTIPADRAGSMTSVVATASNDAWSATTRGLLQSPLDPIVPRNQRPHLYRLTDGLPPAAAPGDDDETRPIVVREDPPIFIEEPELPEPPAEVGSTTVTNLPPTRTQIKVRPAMYAVRVTKPRRVGRDRFVMTVRFRLRRPVTIGVQALRRNVVVSRSGVKRFRGTRGKLTLTLHRRRWPTRIRFVTGAGPSEPRVARPPSPTSTGSPG